MTGQPQAPAANRPALSPDQADAWDALAETFQNAGVDLVAEEISPPKPGKGRVMAVIGKAGSGKTLLLSEITRALREAGWPVPEPRWPVPSTESSTRRSMTPNTNASRNG